VSIPLIPETINNLPVYNHSSGVADPVEHPIIPCPENFTAIWRYNATTGSFGYNLEYKTAQGFWFSYDPTFKGIEPDRGYFFVVKSGGAFMWTVIGAVPVENRTVDLADGLNLVGMTSINETRGLLPVYNHSSGVADPVEHPIIPCPENFTAIWRYNATAGSFGYNLEYKTAQGFWFSYDPTFKGIELGRGYFFVVKPGGAFTWEYEP
jgi:hypothetical protein